MLDFHLKIPSENDKVPSENEKLIHNLISVDKGLVKILKPHQKEGVKFMWDACFESRDSINTSTGGGCILAHCMGLGKSVKFISLFILVIKIERNKMTRLDSSVRNN